MKAKIKSVNSNSMIDATKILDDISTIFSILHDGGISAWTGDKDLLTLEIDCEYLAERIDKSYNNFYIKFGQIEKIELHPWMNSIELSQTVLTDIEDIFKGDLEILSADIENGFVNVYCNQHDTDFDYRGGSLLLNCKTINIFDQGKRQLTIDELTEVCKGYWDSFSKKQCKANILQPCNRRLKTATAV